MEEDLQDHRVNKVLNQNSCLGTSLVVQRLRLHLQMQRMCSTCGWLVGGLSSQMPHEQKNQNINNRSNIVTNSTKTLKMVHV